MTGPDYTPEVRDGWRKRAIAILNQILPPHSPLRLWDHEEWSVIFLRYRCRMNGVPEFGTSWPALFRTLWVRILCLDPKCSLADIASTMKERRLSWNTLSMEHTLFSAALHGLGMCFEYRDTEIYKAIADARICYRSWQEEVNAALFATVAA